MSGAYMFRIIANSAWQTPAIIVALLAIIVPAVIALITWQFPKQIKKEDGDKSIGREDWPIFDNIPDRPRDIHGRQTSVQELKKLIDTTPVALTGERTNIAAAHGSGGIGKSELANEFARYYKQNYEGVWIVRAESETTLHNDLAQLGDKIGYKSDLGPREKALAILQTLKSRADYWLIIYDNVTDQAAINQYLISGSKLHYLITTRSSLWENIKTYTVGLLGYDEALRLLEQVSGRKDKGLGEIVKKLQGYPLALIVAGAYLKNNHGATVKAYLEDFEARLKDTSVSDYAPTRDPDLTYSPSILSSLSLTIDQLSENGKDLLSLISFFSADDIWPELIEEGVNTEDSDGAHEWPDFIGRMKAQKSILNDALTELRAASLIEPKEAGITMHRLTQEVMKALLKKDRVIWADAAIRMLNELTPNETASPFNWPRLDRLMPHLERLMRHVPASPAADRVIGNIGNYLGRRGQSGQALTVLEIGLGISEKQNGADSPEHARSLNNLASAYEVDEQFEKAESLYKKALDIERDANSINNLAGLYLKTNRFDDAEKLYVEAEDIDKNTLGTDHPNYAR